jgi:hypothetical protein
VRWGAKFASSSSLDCPPDEDVDLDAVDEDDVDDEVAPQAMMVVVKKEKKRTYERTIRQRI